MVRDGFEFPPREYFVKDVVSKSDEAKNTCHAEIKGSVCKPYWLKVGYNAHLMCEKDSREDGDVFRTSEVVSIDEQPDGLLHFETVNTHYYLLPIRRFDDLS